jgi:hypothetical protein
MLQGGATLLYMSPKRNKKYKRKADFLLESFLFRRLKSSRIWGEVLFMLCYPLPCKGSVICKTPNLKRFRKISAD